MKVKRSVLHHAFERNWCPKCGAVTGQTVIETNLPGIFAQRCDCGLCFQANYLGGDNELVEVPDTFTFPERDN